MEVENLIKENWPSAVQGDLSHSDLGIIHYWTGEEKDRIVVRFVYEGQSRGESEKIFFIKSNKKDWILTQISTFRPSDNKLKLTRPTSINTWTKGLYIFRANMEACLGIF